MDLERAKSDYTHDSVNRKWEDEYITHPPIFATSNVSKMWSCDFGMLRLRNNIVEFKILADDS